MRGIEPPGGMWVGIAGLDLVRDPSRRVPRARGQRDDAERLRLRGCGARGGHRRARAGRRRAAARLRRGPGPPGRRAARRRGGRRRSVPDRADRRARERRVLGALVGGPPDRRAARDARRAAPRRRRACATATTASTASTAARTPTRCTPRSARCSAPAIRAGTVGVVNAFGSGVGRRQARARLCRGHDPLLSGGRASCAIGPDLDLARRDHLEQALDRFERARHQAARRPAGGRRRDDLPARRSGGRRASARARARRPQQWVAQPLVDLSTHRDADRRRARPPARRPAPVRVHARPRPPARDARRPHALRARRGRRSSSTRPRTAGSRTRGCSSADRRHDLGGAAQAGRQPLPEGDLPQPEIVLGVVYARAVEERRRRARGAAAARTAAT